MKLMNGARAAANTLQIIRTSVQPYGRGQSYFDSMTHNDQSTTQPHSTPQRINSESQGLMFTRPNKQVDGIRKQHVVSTAGENLGRYLGSVFKSSYRQGIQRP